MEDLSFIFSLINSGFSAIVANFGVLFILAWSVSSLDRTSLGLEAIGPRYRSVLAGLVFGLAASLSMLIPLEVEPGLIADIRSVPLFFSGFLLGPWSAGVCFGFAILTRLCIGGVGLFPGLGLIFVMSASGLITAQLKSRLGPRWHWSSILPLGVMALASLLVGPLLLLLPEDKQFTAFWIMQPNMLLGNCLGTYVLMKLFRSERSIEVMRSKQEKARRVLDARVERMIQNSPGMVYQFLLKTNGDAAITYMSSQGFKIYEIDEQDFADNDQLPTQLVHPDDQSSLSEKILRSAQTLDWFEWEGRIITPKGNLKWVKARSAPEKQPNGDILWDGLMIDITREVKLNRDLEQQRKLSAHKDKLASIGELAAGVGHEINNPLAVILGNLGLLLQHSEELPGPVLKKVLVADRAAQRIRDIVSGLRRFSRTDDREEIFKAKRVLDDLSLLFSEIYKHQGIDLVFESELADDTYLSGSAGQLQQAIVNLIANARDATEGKKKRLIKVRGRESSGLVEFTVEDNGHGIPQDIQEKVFNAFFTTKDHGKGTGLGLSLSQEFVTHLHGQLELVKTSSQGSVFRIHLPAARGPSLKAAAKGLLPSGVSWLPEPGRSSRPLRVLIAEDSEDILQLLTEWLKQEGCQVSVVPDGCLALKELKTTADPYDLMISDVNMPQVTGLELVSCIRGDLKLAQPKILLITGGSPLELALESAIDDRTRLIFKPFGSKQLADVLQWARQNSDDPSLAQASKAAEAKPQPAAP